MSSPTKSASSSRSYITFRLGDEPFAIDVAQVQEVLDLSEITQVPTAPEYLLGVINLRGGAIPVVDLRRRFGVTPRPPTVQTRIMVLELDLDGERSVVGGLADSVHDVIVIDDAEIKEAPRIAMRWRAEMVTGLVRHADQFVLILDIARVFSTDAPMLLAAAA